MSEPMNLQYESEKRQEACPLCEKLVARLRAERESLRKELAQARAVPGLPEGMRVRCIYKRTIGGRDFDRDEVIWEAELESISL